MSPIRDRPGRARAFCAALAITLPGAPPTVDDEYAGPRIEMVEVIKDHAEGVAGIIGGPLDTAVLEVMGRVPRHAFVPERDRRRAYADRPLAIGYGQTISQPFIVALMTHLLGLEPGDAVLEVGTGSGYQAAVLSPLAARVCTIEIIPGLGRSAAERLQRLGYDKIRTRIGDGYYGWEACGPFDGIVVTAAASHVPPPLIDQLAPGGRMVIPVGGPFVTQQLMLIEKAADGRITTRQLLPVRFVPLTGRH